MVAVKNRVDSPGQDRVELSWHDEDGRETRRMWLMDRTLWLDARILATGMPWPFDGLGFDLSRQDVTRVVVDQHGVMLAAEDFADDPSSLVAAIEIFCLIVAAHGEAT